MKINFTKAQYRKLLDIIFAGNMMINGIRNNDEAIKDYQNIEQYIYSFAKTFDCEDLIEYDLEFQEYLPTKKFEEGEIEHYSLEYDDYIFWQELVGKLARRDVVREVGLEDNNVSEEEFEEILKRQFEIEGKYDEEFCKNGLENVKVEFKD